MHIYFGGIGGSGISGLALIAHKAGFKVSGSDKQESSYTNYLKAHGIEDIQIGQTGEEIAKVHAADPIDWYVYTSALPKENPNHPELAFVESHAIRHSKRDEFLNYLIEQKNLKLIAIAGTHGKTTTTAMAIWLFKQLHIPISYNLGGKIGFGELAEYSDDSEYFIYECDEYDRNFLSFKPFISIISGIDWDHADVYPTREDYYQAFRDYIDQSQKVVMWQADASRLGIGSSDKVVVLPDSVEQLESLTLPGLVNRQDAKLVDCATSIITSKPETELATYLNEFPGVSRRFEAITTGLYSDYAHTPKKIEGALQLAHEVAGDNVVVVYEGLHNTRQHFIKSELEHMFDSVKTLYIVPSYLAREDPHLALLTPEDLVKITSQPQKAYAAQLDDNLKKTIQTSLANGDLVLCLTAGGGGSLDDWLRENFS